MEIEKPIRKKIRKSNFGLQKLNNFRGKPLVNNKINIQKKPDFKYLWDNFRKKSLTVGPLWTPIKQSNSFLRRKSIRKSQNLLNKSDFSSLKSIISGNKESIWKVFAKITPQKRLKILELISYLQKLV